MSRELKSINQQIIKHNNLLQETLSKAQELTQLIRTLEKKANEVQSDDDCVGCKI